MFWLKTRKVGAGQFAWRPIDSAETMEAAEAIAATMHQIPGWEWGIFRNDRRHPEKTLDTAVSPQ